MMKRARQGISANTHRESDAPAVREGVTSVQIKISARHGHLSEPTQEFIRDKAQKLLRIFERLTLIEVTVDLKNDYKTVEFVVSAEHKHDFVASESHQDILAAVDLA